MFICLDCHQSFFFILLHLAYFVIKQVKLTHLDLAYFENEVIFNFIKVIKIMW